MIEVRKKRSLDRLAFKMAKEQLKSKYGPEYITRSRLRVLKRKLLN